MRHAKVHKRKIEPDVLYNSVAVTKLINYIMQDGKKSTAQKQIYDAFKILTEKGEEPLKTFDKAMQNVGPKVEVKARRVGGANYQVPVEVKHERRLALALRWIIEAAKKRSNKEYHTFSAKMAAGRGVSALQRNRLRSSTAAAREDLPRLRRHEPMPILRGKLPANLGGAASRDSRTLPEKLGA